VAGRRLGADEAALWAKVRASIRPIRPVAALDIAPASGSTRAFKQPPEPPRPAPRTANATTLDGGWDRRIARGMVVPDYTLDLHGHTLRSAHAMLDAGIDHAIARGDRVLLLITGKPPRPESERPHARGAIRAAVGDWLAGSRHAGAIAAVRGAHPRHGGSGALYIILRRPKTAQKP